MASFPANFMQQNVLQPSIFELVAQDAMTTALRPAITYAIKTVAQHYSCGWLFQFNEEVYGLLDVLLQYYSLAHYNASFYENFYGLRRTPKGAGAAIDNLSRKHKILSALFLVGVPYAKVKLDSCYNQWKEEIRNAANDIIQHAKARFVAMYPYFHFVFQALFLAYNLMYAFDIDDSFSPLLKLAGLRLRLLTRHDLQLMQSKIDMTQESQTDKLSTISKLLMFVSRPMSFIAKLLSSGLPLLAFFLKIVEWWYSPDNTTRSLSTFGDLPIPPPPEKPKPAEGGIKVPFNPAECALCEKIITNATALSTSGYVFCYPCIYQHITQHGRCPVTHLPTSTQQLIKVYPSASSK